MKKQVSVLVVCTGNICRSPTGEGVLRHLAEKRGLGEKVRVASAGTHDYHVGECPDPRTVKHAKRRGYDLSAQRAQQLSPDHFREFDYILAMDETHVRQLKRLSPPEHTAKVRLFMEFAGQGAPREVPDPYYGGAQGFERVLDLVEQASRGLLDHLRSRIS